jgi:hypothetical protein
MALLLKPHLLHAIVCENGKVYSDGGGLAASESLRAVKDSQPEGSKPMCGCKIHRVVQYLPGASEEIRVNHAKEPA